MFYVEDTQIKHDRHTPGTILDNGKLRVEFDSTRRSKCPPNASGGRGSNARLFTFRSATITCLSRSTTLTGSEEGSRADQRRLRPAAAG